MSRPLAIGPVALGTRPVVVAAGGMADVDALAAAREADVVELRADLGDDPTVEQVLAALSQLRAAGRPVLLTARAASEGGRPMPEERRAAVYAAGLSQADAIDVEIASAHLVADLVPRARRAGCVVVLSAHDFAATPAADVLLALVERARSLGADVTKLATTVQTLADLRTLLAVTLEARERDVATLGMGPLGPLSRVVLPAAGSLLTYAAAGTPTAPGQLPVAELAAMIRRLWPAS